MCKEITDKLLVKQQDRVVYLKVVDYYKLPNGIRHGLCRIHKWTSTDQIYLEREYYYKNGKEHGIYRAWESTGQLSYETGMKDGELHGLTRRWFTNGQLSYEQEHKDGKPHGFMRRWNRQGQLKSGKNTQ